MEDFSDMLDEEEELIEYTARIIEREIEHIKQSGRESKINLQVDGTATPQNNSQLNIQEEMDDFIKS